MGQQIKTIRIFISSTFKDMHSERDYLVKFVFPELRERCVKKGLSLVDVDLRWGVSQAEAEQGKAIEICLDEIENCRPFFIGLLGERYGWTPNSYQVPDYQQYDWLKNFESGHSVTALEIYHGVLNRKEMRPRAFFYFRNPVFVNDVPIAKRADVMAESPKSEEKLFHLKENIKDTFSISKIPGHITENYPCFYKGLKINWQSVKSELGDQLNPEDIAILEEVAGNDNLVDNIEYARLNQKQQSIVDKYSHVYLDGLEGFGNEVLADIWGAIDEEYPDGQTETNPVLIEKAYHTRFLESRTRMFIGRETIIDQIFTYIGDDGIHKPLIVTGEPGSGKSAIIAVTSQRNIDNHNGFTISRFVGASPDSLEINKLVIGIIGELAFIYNLSIDEKRLEEPVKLYEYFRELLFTVGEIGNLTLFIDALNQLKPTLDPQYLTWLPKYLPGNVKIVLSSLEGDFTANSKKYDLPFLRVEKLSSKDSAEILQNTLGEYRKTLSEKQIESILAKAEATKPLYLKVASEELRVFANFDLINSRIENLPDTIPDLFAQMLERLETDHNPELVKDTMCLLECSMYGLLESELLELLKPEDKEKLPLNTWARLYRNLAPYLLNAGNNNEGLFDFFHLQLSFAVRARYLKNEETEKYYYKRLANYGLGKYKLKNGDKTNTVLYTGLYFYQAKEEEILYNLLKNIFSSDNTNYEAYQGIASELCNWTIETYNFDIEVILKKSINQMTTLDKPHLLALFLNKKGEIYQETGNIKWALYFFENSLLIMSYLIVNQMDDLVFKFNLSECYSNAGNIYSIIGEGSKAIEFFLKQMKILNELVVQSPDRAELKKELCVSYKNLGEYYSSIGDSKKSFEFFEKDLQLMEELVTIEPNRTDFKRDLSISYKNIGSFYSETGDGKKALYFFEKDLKVMEELVELEPKRSDFKRDLTVSYKNIGTFYSETGEGKKALSFFEKDLKVMEELVELEPNRSDFKRDLSVSCKNIGSFFSESGEGKKALHFFEKDLKVMEELIEKEPLRTDFKRDLSVTYSTFGNFYSGIGKGKKARSFFEKDLKVMEELVELEPHRTDFKRDLAVSYKNIGSFYSETGEGNKALFFYTKDLHIMEELIALEPHRSDFKRDLSVSYSNIGTFYSETGEGKKALSFFEKDLKVMEELVELEPNRSDFKRDLSISLRFIGKYHSEIGDKQKALDFFEKENALLIELEDLESGQLDFKRELSVSFSNLGKIYSDMGNKQKAIEFFGKDIQITQELVATEPKRTDFRWDLSVSYNNFGKIYSESGEEKKALTFFKKQNNTMQKLIAIDPNRIDFQVDYAESLLNIFKVCPIKEKNGWLYKAKDILEPIINKGVINQQLTQLWGMVNEAIGKIENK